LDITIVPPLKKGETVTVTVMTQISENAVPGVPIENCVQYLLQDAKDEYCGPANGTILTTLPSSADLCL
jgi:hypothetical protein